MTKPQIIKTETGEEMIVLTRRGYDALLARSGDEAAEDRMAARILDETQAKIDRGEDVALPLEVWVEIEEGESPIKAIRKHRGLTQAELAALVGCAQPTIAQIETGEREGKAVLLLKIARALGVPMEVLIDED